MDFTSIASSAAKSNWMRVAISLLFLSAPLCTEGPVVEFFVKSEANEEKQDGRRSIRDFFIKDKTKSPSKKKTPIRDFFFKDSGKERNTDPIVDKSFDEEKFDLDEDRDNCLDSPCCTDECTESSGAPCECNDCAESCSYTCDCCN